jgi:Carbohydrate binding domain
MKFFRSCFVAFAIGTMAVGLGSCSSPESSESAALILSDFEQFDGWIPSTPSLTTDVAHSGKHSIRAGKDIEYSLTYSRALGLLSPKRFQKVKLSAWAYLTDASAGEAILTFALYDPNHENQQTFWVGLQLKEQVKVERKWQQVTKEITLPASADFGHDVRLFLWKASAGSYAYLDDLRVEVIE